MLTGDKMKKIITDIKQQVKNEKRYSIFINDAFAFGITGVDVLFYKLEIGKELTTKELDKIIEETQIAKGRDIAFKYISYKNRTEKEVKDKLLEKDYSEEVIENILETLREYNYVNDEKYAIDMQKELINFKMYGEYRIRQILFQKGINKEIVDCLEYDYEKMYNNAIKLLKSKYKNISPDYKEKQKIFGFLTRKGYSYDIIKESYEEVFKRNEEDESSYWDY